MKLGKLGIFFILLISLLLGGLGYSTYEVMSNRKEGLTNKTSDNIDSSDDVNSYNDSPNQNNSTYDYISATPTSLAISEDQQAPPNSNPTSTAITVDVNDSQSKSSMSSSNVSSSSPPPPPPNSGGDDQYILKSQVVPPVCPKCPDAASCPRPKPCPPCAPCARCPEPAFECKKVPTYHGGPYPTMPKPVLNDFSQFGM